MFTLLIGYLLSAGSATGAASNAESHFLLQPKPRPRDTIALIAHRWLAAANEKESKKSPAVSVPLYMNFFSDGGFDFAGMGDGEPLTWKWEKGRLKILPKSEQAGAPEAIFTIEKIGATSLVISGIQSGTPVRYRLTHQPGD